MSRRDAHVVPRPRLAAWNSSLTPGEQACGCMRQAIPHACRDAAQLTPQPVQSPEAATLERLRSTLRAVCAQTRYSRPETVCAESQDLGCRIRHENVHQLPLREAAITAIARRASHPLQQEPLGIREAVDHRKPPPALHLDLFSDVCAQCRRAACLPKTGRVRNTVT